MTDQQHGEVRRRVGLMTTAIVSLGTAAAVGWAAAVPVDGFTSSASASPASQAATVRTAQQLDTARANLQQVQHDLARLLSREDDMPRAKAADLSRLVAALKSVQVPQAHHVAPPATHATTGASGAGS